jgi:hypothetical protein
MGMVREDEATYVRLVQVGKVQLGSISDSQSLLRGTHPYFVLREYF